MSDGLEPNIVTELLRCCNDEKRRISKFCAERPTVWKPQTVLDPNDSEGRCFTDNAAWQYIVQCLEQNTPIQKIELDIPSGKTGYVMKIKQPDNKIIYIKLQLFNPPGVVGRSFHYSRYS